MIQCRNMTNERKQYMNQYGYPPPVFKFKTAKQM